MLPNHRRGSAQRLGAGEAVASGGQEGPHNSTAALLPHPKITAIRRGPGGKAEWLLTLDGVCSEAPMRDRRLRSYKRFCNVIKFRFGIEFGAMPQADWDALLERARREGGAS